MAELMFESYQVPGLFIGTQSAMSLYSSGQTTGLVVDSGANESYVVPVYQGAPMTSAIQRLSVAGNDVTARLYDLLNSNATIKLDSRTVNEIKERHCLIRKIAATSCDSLTREYTLPDGSRVQLGSELCEAPEVLFRPVVGGIDLPGLHEFVYRSVKRTPDELANFFYTNIVLAGANTLMAGFGDRLKHEMTVKLTNERQSFNVGVMVPDDRRYSSWIGASILGLVSNFGALCATRHDYDEHGSNVVRKFS